MSGQPHLVTYAGEHLCFERLIADLSKRFIDLHSTKVDCEIEAAQKIVCEALGFDRSMLALWDEGAEVFIVTHSWDSSAFESGFKFNSQNLHWFSSKILRGEEVRFTYASELIPDASRKREMTELLGPKSSIIFPLQAGGQVFGGLAFGTLRHEREWSEQVVDRLRLIANLFSNALARKRSDEALLESQEQVRLAVETAGLGLWTWDLRRDDIWASEKTYSLIGLPQSDPLTYKRFLDAVHLEDRATVHDSIGTA